MTLTANELLLCIIFSYRFFNKTISGFFITHTMAAQKKSGLKFAAD